MTLLICLGAFMLGVLLGYVMVVALLLLVASRLLSVSRADALEADD